MKIEATVREYMGDMENVMRQARTPTVNELTGMNLLAESEDGSIRLYENGYAVYDNGTSRTVFFLPEYRSFTFWFGASSAQGSKATLSFDDLADLPLSIAVTMIGEHRIEANVMNRRQGCGRKGTRDFAADMNGDKNDDREKAAEKQFLPNYTCRAGWLGENPEKVMIRNESWQEMMGQLTVKQKEAFLLYFEQGFTQWEIAEMLGIGRTTVEDRLKGAKKKIKRILNRYRQKGLAVDNI